MHFLIELTIDLGTNSIGWALRNPDLTENQIEKFGVLTFNKGVGLGKTGEYSYAAERTKKRSTRRLYQARKYRLWATLEHLINEGYCPLSIENLNRWRHYSKAEARKNNNGGRIYPVDDLLFDTWIKLDFNGDGKPDYISPYQLRKELAEIKLDFTKKENWFKLGRALYHIAQRRGFKSSRKGTDDLKGKETDDSEIVDLQYSEKKKNKVITELFEKYTEAKTIGTLFALLENDNIRIRESIAQYAIRENYKDEIKYIFQFQILSFSHSLYTKLVESGTNKNDGSIFYKRPLGSQKGLIGRCTLEPNKYRAPISHPSFEIFRAWSFLNNIKYKPINDKDAYWQPLNIELKQSLYNKLFFRKKAYFPFSDITDFIKKEGKKWILNYKDKTTVTGCPVSARLKDILGDDYLNVKITKKPSLKAHKDFYDIEDIWHVLFSFEDQEYVAEYAEQKLNLSPEKVKQVIIAWNSLPVGYAMLSLNAINKINVFLKQGLIYTEAVLLAKIPEIIGNELWAENETLFIDTIGKLIEENRGQKTTLNIVNSLVSKHKNLEANKKFGYKDSSYKITESDITDIENAIKEQFGVNKWNEKPKVEKEQIFANVKDCYQVYFITSGLVRKDINNERHFVVESNNTNYYKTDSGYYRLPKLIDTLGEFLQMHFKVDDKHLKKIYHPSEINIYPPAKPDKDGVLKLGSPKTGSFKNPMAMRTLHELRKLINYMIESNQIDSETRIVVEVARELNDANKRWAIEAWQRQREAENTEFALAIEQLLNELPGTSASSQSNGDIDKMRLWYEQNGEEPLPSIAEVKKEIKWSESKKDSYKEIAAQKSIVDKYRLWKEQECCCIYTGKIISITNLFDENVIDFEHTIPRSISFDNSLANLTVCYADFNRNVKKNQIPFNLNNYDDILARIEKWKDKVERIKQQIDFWKTKSKRATDKSWKDDAIRQRHLWQMELDYWKNKVDRFTMEEVTGGFKNSQLVDTQLISKYALHYLKTYFEKVDVQKGSNTAVFRKIYGLQVANEKKDRSKYSHHAKDAAVLTLIPMAAKREEILKKYYEHQEKKLPFILDAYKGFNREFVWSIDDNILINNINNAQALTPAKRIIRKRGKVEFIDGTNQPKIATGDCIRGQLHLDTFYGAIKPAKRGEKGNIEKDEAGRIIQEEKVKYVLRVPFQYKAMADGQGFKTFEDIEKQVVDAGLKSQILLQLIKVILLKENQVLQDQVVEKFKSSNNFNEFIIWVDESNFGDELKERMKKVNKSSEVLKEAFEQGIYMLDKNGIKVNKIRHIRCWASVSEPLAIKKQTNLSTTDYKQYYYAGNATNSYFALYEGEGKINFDYRNLFETAQVLSSNNITTEKELFEPLKLIIKGKTTIEVTLKYILKNGLKVIFLKDNDEDVKTLSKQELSKRLYEYTNFEKNGNSARLNFRFHLEARNKITDEFVESKIDFDNPKPTLRFAYSKYKFIVENYEFKMQMDGSIKLNN